MFKHCVEKGAKFKSYLEHTCRFAIGLVLISCFDRIARNGVTSQSKMAKKIDFWVLFRGILNHN